MLPWAGMYHIAIALDQDYVEGIATLAHEMVHIWQHMGEDVNMYHGKRFIKKCREIEKAYDFKYRQVGGTENTDEALFVD